MTAPVGLLAGAGRFPILFAQKARELGLPVVCVGVADMADPALASVCTEFHWLRRISIGFVARTFRRGGVTRWTMAGKYHKHVLFRPWKWVRLLPDWRAARLWLNRRRRDNKDDSLLLALIAEFRKDGLECVSALDLCPELLVRDGVLTKRKPTDRELADVRFGWTLAREMGRLDVGQSVMVRDRACIAVEAIEGTDKCIERAGELCGRAAFAVVKVAKPNQDMRFDVPTVGTQTIATMTRAGATVLGIEAGKTILLDEAETLAAADRAGIAVVALSGP
jgi:DUF1009 family protein